MCGEKRFVDLVKCLPSGSPPHVRGKVVSGFLVSYFRRITPACAGKSRKYEYGLREPEDHPRMCGEKDNTFIQILVDKGSPPHVRGKGL